MKFYLARHCQAESGEDMDPTRPLTSVGEAQIPVLADFLETQTDKITAVLCSSDMKRGIDTGEGLAKRLDADVIYTPWVDPDATAAKCWKVIQKTAAKLDDGKELLVICHGPMIADLVHLLLDIPPGDRLHITHGTIMHFDTEEPGPASGYPIQGRGGNPAYLHWLATPKLMNRAMQDDHDAVIGEALRIADEILGVHLDEKGKRYTYDTVNEKRWQLGDGGRSGNCEDCVEANDLGWIDDDAVFDMFDSDADGPPGHPNCTCELEYRERRVRVYESGERVTESVRTIEAEDRDSHGRFSSGGDSGGGSKTLASGAAKVDDEIDALQKELDDPKISIAAMADKQARIDTLKKVKAQMDAAQKDKP